MLVFTIFVAILDITDNRFNWKIDVVILASPFILYDTNQIFVFALIFFWTLSFTLLTNYKRNNIRSVLIAFQCYNV